MQIGVIGLGRMGGNISRRLIKNGHEVVVYDHDAKAVAALSRDGAKAPVVSTSWCSNCGRRARSGSCCRPARSPRT